ARGFSRRFAPPPAAQRDPDIDDFLAELALALVLGAKPPRHGLRSEVGRIDAMDDAVEGEAGKHPVDRGARRLYRVALAAAFLRDAPADLEAGPARRIPGADAADITT